MRIGIVSPWYERGIAVISLDIYHALHQYHEVYVLAQSGRPRPKGSEWQVPGLRWAEDKEFANPLGWARKNRLDVVIFNERLDTQRLAPIRQSGIKTVCLLEWEFVGAGMVNGINDCYDAVIAPTLCAYHRYRDIGIENVRLVRWGVDLSRFRPTRRRGLIRFFQPANFGGMFGRKNVPATRAAWERAGLPNAQLLIALQKGCDKGISDSVIRGTQTRKEMAQLYRGADVVLLPSAYEGLGLCFLEALASGCAVVTVDAPPMCEYVRHGYNGLLCEARMLPSRDSRICVPWAEIDLGDFSEKIGFLAGAPALTRQLGERSREIAAQEFDIRRTHAELLRLVEGIGRV